MSSAFCYTPPALMLDLFQAGEPCHSLLAQASEFYWIGLTSYLKYFFLTCALESPFYLLALRSRGKTNTQVLLLSSLFAILLCNFATHPIVCFLFPWVVSLIHGSYSQSLMIGEVFAPVVEALLLAQVWNVPTKKAWMYSILANLFSWWVGVYLVV